MPPAIAGVAREREAAERLEVGLLEGEACRPRPGRAPAPARRRARDSGARRRSARACPGWPRCASEAPSFSCTSAWTIDSGCTTTSMRLVGEAEQVVRLDQLEALVHQRRRVDRDLAAHVPGRVRERRLDARRRAARRCVMPRNGPAGGRQDQPVDRLRAARPAAAGRAPSARSRPGSRARRSPRRAASRARRPTTRLSLFASARSMPSPSAATVGPSPAEPTRPFRTRSAPDSAISRTMPSGPASTSPPLQAVRPRAAASSSASATRVTPCAAACAEQPLPAASPRVRPTTSQVVAALDDVERLRADRPGRARITSLAACGDVQSRDGLRRRRLAAAAYDRRSAQRISA